MYFAILRDGPPVSSNNSLQLSLTKRILGTFRILRTAINPIPMLEGVFMIGHGAGSVDEGGSNSRCLSIGDSIRHYPVSRFVRKCD